MKKINLFKWMVALMMLPMGARAQFQTGNFCLEKDIQPVRSNHIVSNVARIEGTDKSEFQTENYNLYTVSEANKAPRKAGNNDVTVTFNLEYDANSFYVEDFYCLNVENNEPYYPVSQDDNSINFHIPKGQYDLMIRFDNGEAVYYVIKELVDVEDDMSLTFYPDLATNRIEVKNYAPNGDRIKLDVGYWDEEGNRIVVDKGNVIGYTTNTIVCLKGKRRVFYGDSGHYYGLVSKEESRYPQDIYVNDVSDRYLFVHNRMILITGESGLQEYYICQFSTDDVKCGVLENSPENYVLCEELYEVTPYGKTHPGVGWAAGYQFMYNNEYSGEQFRTSGFGITDKTDEWPVRIYVDMPYDNPRDSNAKSFLWSGAGFHTENVTQPWGGVEPTIPLMNGSPFKIVNGKMEYINMHYSEFFQNPTNDFVFPGREEFTYPASMKAGTYGDNCPINAISVINYFNPWTESKTANVGNVYVGRYSETRWCDNPMTTLGLKFNGEEIENPHEFQPDVEGVFDVTMVNTNIEVDGLPGKNTTTVHFDLTQEDYTPPTIEMLQFKNSDSMITDRFEKGEDGTMVFTAADIHFFMDSDGYSWYDYRPINVTVEYAPYNKDNWTEMAIEEVPELYNENGWGYYYQTSLKDVEGAGEKGWFDLRFSMADAAGNTHVQTVSPAFRIDDLVDTGISQLTNDNGQSTIPGNETVYDVMGRRLANAQSSMSNGQSQKGIHIVRRADGDVRKVVVR